MPYPQERSIVPKENVILLCKEIIETCDEIKKKHEDNAEACEFAESVSEKVNSMYDYLLRTGYVTKPQYKALDNMSRGAQRWLDK